MHFEILVEDQSGKIVLDLLLPKILRGDESHTFRVHPYKGIGRIPKGMKAGQDPKKRFLLDQLPLVTIADRCHPRPRLLVRIAIEEVEAWLLGDRDAVLAAYPRANRRVFGDYEQDSICATWELLADAIHAGGATDLKNKGWPAPGQAKSEWARRIAPHMDVEANRSPSFAAFRDGIRKLL
jgi:hypothetical protein